jgi:hypothetical protein
MKFLVFLILFLCSCSSWVSKNTELLINPPPAPPPAKIAVPQVVVPEKEPGTLWTDNSKWNDAYSISLSKKPGDIVFIKPSEEFRNLVSSFGGKMPVRKSENPNVPVEPIPVISVIREVLPRNILKVAAQSNPLVIEGDTDVRFVAKIRERDVTDDDMINSDLMFDLNFEVLNPPKPEIDKVTGKEIKKGMGPQIPPPGGVAQKEKKNEQK